MGRHGSVGCRELLGTVFGFGVCVCMDMSGYAHPGVVDDARRRASGCLLVPFFIWEGAWPGEVRGQLRAVSSLLLPRRPWDLKDVVRIGGKHLYPCRHLTSPPPYFLRHKLSLNVGI